ncbi:MAG: hypothetical protein ACLFS6_08190 [Methanomassiliicoccales archaeon]
MGSDDGDGAGNGDGDLTGTETYSGTWSGSSSEMGDIGGIWEFTVDFDEGTVSGWFSGDGSSDISGTVSDGILSAEGQAAFGTITWSGDFSSDGSEVSGNWEITDANGSGNWNGSVGEADDNGDGDTNGDTEQTYWNAFDFENAVEQDGTELGMLKEFTFEQTYMEEGSEKRFEVQTTYIDRVTDRQIPVTKLNLSDSTETVMNVSVNTYRLEHNIEVLQDDENMSHPDWIKFTVYIPVGEFGETTQYFWVYSMVEYLDSDDNEAVLSYHLTEEMQSEAEGGEVMYAPYMEGDMYEYDHWVLSGMYVWGWIWFSSFTSEYSFQEDSVSVPTPNGTFSYSVAETSVSVSGYSFTGYEVSVSAVTVKGDGVLQGTFVPSLPVPVYLLVGDEETFSYEFELTDLAFE